MAEKKPKSSAKKPSLTTPTKAEKVMSKKSNAFRIWIKD